MSINEGNKRQHQVLVFFGVAVLEAILGVAFFFIFPETTFLGYVLLFGAVVFAVYSAWLWNMFAAKSIKERAYRAEVSPIITAWKANGNAKAFYMKLLGIHNKPTTTEHLFNFYINLWIAAAQAGINDAAQKYETAATTTAQSYTGRSKPVQRRMQQITEAVRQMLMDRQPSQPE